MKCLPWARQARPERTRRGARRAIVTTATSLLLAPLGTLQRALVLVGSRSVCPFHVEASGDRSAAFRQTAPS